jgi:alanine racemase
MSRKPRLILSRQALASNYQRLSSFSGQAECAASIKANAYGIGIDFVAPILWEAGCRTFFVAYLEEALALRSVIPEAIIYVFHGFKASEAATAAASNIRPVLNTLEDMCLPGIAALRPAVHVDTGMRRLGIPQYQHDQLIEVVSQCQPSLLMSHLASADEPEHSDSEQQRYCFDSVRSNLGILCPPSSLANTAGILLGAPYHYDLVRPGIGLYGGSPDPSDPKGFEPVVTWQAQVIELQQVRRGETVGYGGSYVAPRDLRLATIGLGYADGYLRALSGRGEVFVEDECCPIVGRVSMDLITIDVSSLASIKEGNWVEMMGPRISVDTVAAKANTIGYECLTRLGDRMERVIV